MTTASRFSLKTLILCAMAWAATPHAFALDSEATAQLDWAALMFTFQAGGSGSFSNEQSDVYVEMYDPLGNLIGSDSDSAFDFTTPIEAEVMIDDGFGTTALVNANADGQVLDATALFISPNPGSLFGQGYEYANGTRWASMEALTDGLLIATVPYYVSASTDDVDIFADASIYISFDKFVDDTVFVSYSANASVYADLQFGSGGGSDSGILAIAVPLVAGDQFNFQASVYASIWADGIVVPLPAAGWMLFSGVLLLLRRRS